MIFGCTCTKRRALCSSRPSSQTIVSDRSTSKSSPTGWTLIRVASMELIATRLSPQSSASAICNLVYGSIRCSSEFPTELKNCTPAKPSSHLRLNEYMALMETPALTSSSAV